MKFLHWNDHAERLFETEHKIYCMHRVDAKVGEAGIQYDLLRVDSSILNEFSYHREYLNFTIHFGFRHIQLLTFRRPHLSHAFRH